MEKTKVWFVCNWDEIYDENVGLRAFRNWPDNDLFELSETDYEYLIVLGGFRQDNIKYFKDKKKTIGFLLEPEWSGNWQRNLDEYCELVVAQEAHMFKGDNIVEHALFMLTQSTDHHALYIKGDFPKKKRMSIVISNHGPKPNYDKRFGLFTALLETDLDIDFYGRNWNVSDSRYKGAPHNKSDALMDYEYSIGIENSNYPNYLTEKFFDLIVCNTVPIYYGCTNVDKLYPPDSFFEIDFSRDVLSAVEQITDIYHNDDYSARLPSVLIAKSLYYNEYNIFNFLHKWIMIEKGEL